MNDQSRPADMPLTTQAAEGLPRRRWLTAELLKLAELGVFRDARGNEERFELIGGEVVPMPPKGNRHEVLRDDLSYHLRKLAPGDVRVTDEAQFNLAPDCYTIADIMVRPASIPVCDVKGPDALLIVGIAETSLPYDLSTKARVYASFGLREYWVVNAATCETRVFRDPGPNGYPAPRIVPPNEVLAAHLCPWLSVKLGDVASPFSRDP